MNINRNIIPPFKEITKITTPEVEHLAFDNGTKVHVVRGGSQDILKIDFIFDAGTYFQKAPIEASMCSAMLNEGSEKYNAMQIAESFDFHGAYINTNISNHRGAISVFCLSKDLDAILDVTEDIIKRSIFPEDEFKTILQNRKNTFNIELEKTSSLARKQFLISLFGEQHSYSNIVEARNFDVLKREQLIDFYKNRYQLENCNIIVSGKVKDSHIDALRKRFSDKSPLINKIEYPLYKISSCDKKRHFIEKKDAVQSSIRVGCLSINKKHEDFKGLEILNTVLGGYFGSRLMSNIREDKGYTYGISSAIASLPDCGYFAIATDVATAVRDNTLKEIYKEIDILQNELIPEKELVLVKNYMTGELLRSLDGCFSISELVNLNLTYGFGLDYYQDYLNKIKSIDSITLRSLAQKYFKRENLLEIVAGA